MVAHDGYLPASIISSRIRATVWKISIGQPKSIISSECLAGELSGVKVATVLCSNKARKRLPHDLKKLPDRLPGSTNA